MKAAEITDRLIDELQTGRYRHARVNYANGDMVGHTGHHEAAIQAVEAVDLQLARLLPVIETLGGALVITADHGNADCMFEIDEKTEAPVIDARGSIKPKTSHTLNPVPLHIFAPGTPLELVGEKTRRADKSPAGRMAAASGLANLASTILYLMGYDAPDDYQPSLIKSA